MSERKEKAASPSPLPFGRSESPEERRWPSLTPLPMLPLEDFIKLIKQIINRLDAIEKRLERIEKTLMAKQPPPPES